MNETGITVDVSAVERLVEALNPKQLRNASRNAFNRCGRIIGNSVKSAFRSIYPGSPWYKDIHVKAYRSGKGAVIDLVYLKGGRSKSDPMYKSWVMRVLNQGNYKTSPRKTDKGWNRGNVSGTHFFRQGVMAAQAQAGSNFSEELLVAMAKQVNKAAR